MLCDFFEAIHDKKDMYGRRLRLFGFRILSLCRLGESNGKK